jgi:hypothetical protein
LVKYPIRETLAVVRDGTEPEATWADVVALCRAACPSAPWDGLVWPDIGRDVSAATTWLEAQLADLPDARGLYLGLDTLNMRGGRGTNIEIGGSSDCDPLSDDIQWVFARNLRYGRKHLIYGLYELRAVYSSDAWGAAYSLCDYIFFLGYSGVVLAGAFERLDTPRTLLPVWGFHDGDRRPPHPSRAAAASPTAALTTVAGSGVAATGAEPSRGATVYSASTRVTPPAVRLTSWNS